MVRELTLRYLALALGLPFQVPAGTWGGYTRRPRASTHPFRCPGACTLLLGRPGQVFIFPSCRATRCIELHLRYLTAFVDDENHQKRRSPFFPVQGKARGR